MINFLRRGVFHWAEHTCGSIGCNQWTCFVNISLSIMCVIARSVNKLVMVIFFQVKRRRCAFWLKLTWMEKSKVQTVFSEDSSVSRCHAKPDSSPFTFFEFIIRHTKAWKNGRYVNVSEKVRDRFLLVFTSSLGSLRDFFYFGFWNFCFWRSHKKIFSPKNLKDFLRFHKILAVRWLICLHTWNRRFDPKAVNINKKAFMGRWKRCKKPSLDFVDFWIELICLFWVFLFETFERRSVWLWIWWKRFYSILKVGCAYK